MEKPWLELSKEQKLKYLSNYSEDCTFLVGMVDVEDAGLVKGHKEILSSISPVFEKMFNGNFLEATSPDPVVIEDIYFEDFEQFLAFVRNENVYIKNFKSLYNISKKYMTQQIIENIISTLSTAKTPYRSLIYFEIMYLEGKELKLWENSREEATRHFDMIEKSLNTPCIHLLDPNVFLHLIQSLRYTKISHLKLFVAIDHYCKIDSNFNSISQKKYYAGLYLKVISFNSFTPAEFIEHVDPSDLLDLPKKFKILIDICKK